MFSVAAADTDTTGVEDAYKEAVQVTTAVDIFQGGAGVDWTTNLTRGQAATILTRLAGVNEDALTGTSSYTDVQGNWTEKYVAYAEGAGYTVTLYNRGTFYADTFKGIKKLLKNRCLN